MFRLYLYIEKNAIFYMQNLSAFTTRLLVHLHICFDIITATMNRHKYFFAFGFCLVHLGISLFFIQFKVRDKHAIKPYEILNFEKQSDILIKLFLPFLRLIRTRSSDIFSKLLQRSFG